MIISSIKSLEYEIQRSNFEFWDELGMKNYRKLSLKREKIATFLGQNIAVLVKFFKF
jgi:hypothetical protein